MEKNQPRTRTLETTELGHSKSPKRLEGLPPTRGRDDWWRLIRGETETGQIGKEESKSNSTSKSKTRPQKPRTGHPTSFCELSISRGSAQPGHSPGQGDI